MLGRTRALLFLGLALLAVVTVLAVRQARAEPFFFLAAPEPAQPGQVVVVPGPAGLTVYFGLLTADGRPTRSDGQAELVIRDSQGVVYRRERRVRATDFAQVRLPGEQAQTWPLLYGFPWLGYEKDLGSPSAGPGQVQVTITTTHGTVLHGTAAVTFPP